MTSPPLLCVIGVGFVMPLTHMVATRPMKYGIVLYLQVK